MQRVTVRCLCILSLRSIRCASGSQPELMIFHEFTQACCRIAFITFSPMYLLPPRGRWNLIRKGDAESRANVDSIVLICVRAFSGNKPFFMIKYRAVVSDLDDPSKDPQPSVVDPVLETVFKTAILIIHAEIIVCCGE